MLSAIPLPRPAPAFAVPDGPQPSSPVMDDGPPACGLACRKRSPANTPMQHENGAGNPTSMWWNGPARVDRARSTSPEVPISPNNLPFLLGKASAAG